ncbi:MAG TPA: hypothetical protein VN397_03570 [Candidatus Methylomirabilis sp.]|nr:hypothetical protein [Candidatus Methylomirabilis sp.]
MSLKHVLETAKRLGIPVVITDDSGEAAQVVMPFDDFAAMVGHATPPPRKNTLSPSIALGTGHAEEPRVTKKRKGEDEIAEALADLTIERMSDQAREATDRLERDMGVRENSQGFLEDRFYLEPIDDEKSI